MADSNNGLNDQYMEMGISNKVLDFARPLLGDLRSRFEKIDETAEYNQMRVIKAMQDAHVGEACLLGTTGYGYDDIGREGLEKTYAEFFRTEDALVRPQITCGTHALALALMSNLRPGDEMMSASGQPYDTLEEVIGIRPSKGSLAEYGITYAQADLDENGHICFDNIRKCMNEKTKLVDIQRSRGYLERPTLSIKEIGEAIKFIRSLKPEVIIMVDNCYGEFTEREEPGSVGADMIVGSLIKNPGGGLAPTGGYIAGTKECVENAAFRLTSPGLGKEVGASLGILPSYYEGFFLAPVMTAAAIKGAIFAAACYEKLGFECFPRVADERHDIVQAITFHNADAEVAFAQGIQAAAPVDSFVTPYPDEMPGYDDQVVMAAGAFVSGSTVELSADGPMREPYTVYFQGGLTWPHAKFGVLKTIQYLLDRKLITI